MGKITNWVKGEAWDQHDRLMSRAHQMFVQKVMDEENLDYETALALCEGRTRPPEPEFTLGYKMCDPMAIMGLKSFGKTRRNWIAQIEAQLTPDELVLFRQNFLRPRDLKRIWDDEVKKKRQPSIFGCGISCELAVFFTAIVVKAEPPPAP